VQHWDAKKKKFIQVQSSELRNKVRAHVMLIAKAVVLDVFLRCRISVQIAAAKVVERYARE
jgi:hypothetical protein